MEKRSKFKKIDRAVTNELIVVASGTILVFLLYFHTQRIWPDRASRWDAIEYIKMSNDFLKGDRPNAAAPFVFRPGFSTVSALLSPNDVIAGMRIVSTVSGVVSVILMWVWLRGFRIVRGVRIGLVATFSLHYLGPLRFGIFYSTLNYWFSIRSY